MAKKLSEHELKWKIRNERILTTLGPIWTLLFLVLAAHDYSLGRTLNIYLVSPMVLGLLASITGLIVRCQILEYRLQSLEERLH